MSTKEILFRGKRLNNGVWVEGLPSYGINGNIGDMVVYKGFCNCSTIEVKPETVCQYRGLDDKNSKKIFEGDICIICSSSIDEEDGYFVVKWNNEESRFFLDGEGIAVDFGSYYTYEIEVIGNIYDNPELLN